MSISRRWARITLLVLIIGVAVVVSSTGKGLWEWAVYSDWGPHIVMKTANSEYEIEAEWFHIVKEATVLPDNDSTVHYFQVRRKRWSWLPGDAMLRKVEIRKDEFDALMGKEKNRRAKGGQ